MSEENKPVEFSGVLFDLGSMKDVETKYPVLKAGLYIMKVKGFKKDDKPNRTTGKPQSMLLVELVTTDFATNKNSEEENSVPPGHKLTDRIMLTPVGDLTIDMIKQKLARLQEAVLGHHDTVFDTNDLVGQTLTCQVAVRPERTDKGTTYPESNEISKYIPKD